MSPNSSHRFSSTTARRVALARLRHQLLTGAPQHAVVADVVRALGAVQSQDYASAIWAIGMRAPGLTAANVERAFNAGEILRTHVMRPTWHFVASEDLRWMQRLTASRVVSRMASSNRTLGLTPAVFRKSRAVLEKVLSGRQFLTRAQLKAAFDRAKVNTDGTQRLAHLVMHAELDGLICSGPRIGKQFTYALVDERVSTSRDLAGDEALAELTRRYFAAHAPATVHDFAWWSGLSISECRRGVQLLDAEIEAHTLDDVAYFASPGFALPRADSAARTALHLLPNYDEFFIGYRDRSAIADRLRDLKLVTGANALLAHVIVIGGQLVGGWKRAQTASGPSVVPTLLVSLSRNEQAALAAEIERFARFGAPTLAAFET